MKRIVLPHEVESAETHFMEKETTCFDAVHAELVSFLKENSYMTAVTPKIPGYWIPVVLECVKKMKEIDPGIKFITICRYGYRLYISHTPCRTKINKINQVYFAACNRINSLLMSRINLFVK
jgi:hypothetical protein